MSELNPSKLAESRYTMGHCIVCVYIASRLYKLYLPQFPSHGELLLDENELAGSLPNVRNGRGVELGAYFFPVRAFADEIDCFACEWSSAQ